MILVTLLCVVAVAAALPSNLLKDGTTPTDESNIIPIYRPGYNLFNMNILGHEYGRYYDEYNKNVYPYRPYYSDGYSPFAYKYNYFSKYLQPNYEQDLYQFYFNNYKQQQQDVDFFQQNRPYNFFDYFKQQYMRHHFPEHMTNYHSNAYPQYYDREFGYPSSFQNQFNNIRYPIQYPFHQYNYGRFDDTKMRPLIPNDYFYNNMKAHQLKYNVPQYFKTQLKMKDLKINPELEENVDNLRGIGLQTAADLLKKNVHETPLIVETEKIYYQKPAVEYQPTLTTNLNEKLDDVYGRHLNLQ